MKNDIKLDALARHLSDMDKYVAVMTPRAVQGTALAMALVTSSLSLGISVFAGLHRAGSVEEQVWCVATSLVAGLYMQLAPMLLRFVSRGVRFALVVLWLLAAFVVLRGQIDVLAFAGRHAADKRAQTVAEVAVPSVATEPAGRDLTTIMGDIAKVSIDLAHLEARRCMGECPALRISKVELSGRLAALNAEANEVKRRASEQDWLREQASRAAALRESRRADPATSTVARWLGTTEERLDLLMDFLGVIVLEGAACVAWYLAIPRPGLSKRAALVDDRNTTVLQQEVVAPMPGATAAGRVGQTDSHAAAIAEAKSVASDSSRSSDMSEDDLLIAKIHEAVIAGRLTRNLASIRRFLECGQPKATRLNRLYVARFGKARGAERADTVSAA